MRPETKRYYQRKYYAENKEKIRQRKREEYMRRKERKNKDKALKEEENARNLLKLRETAQQRLQGVSENHYCDCQGNRDGDMKNVPVSRQGNCKLCGYVALYKREQRQIDTDFSLLGRVESIESFIKYGYGSQYEV